MEEEFSVPMDCFLCEWESVGNNVLTKIVGEKLGHRRARWDRFASINPVIARLKKDLLERRW